MKNGIQARSAGDYKLAKEYFSQAVDASAKGKDGEKDRARALIMKGNMCKRLQESPEAIDIYKQAIALYEKISGPESNDVGVCLDNMALVYMQMNNYAEADKLEARALKILRKNPGNKNYDLVMVLANLAGNARDQKDLKKSELYAQEALKYALAYSDENALTVANVYELLGSLSSEQDQPKKSLDYHLKAYEIYKLKAGNNDVDTLLSATNLGVAYLKVHQAQDALPLFENAKEGMAKIYGITSKLYAEACFGRGIALEDLGRYLDAVDDLAIYETIRYPNEIADQDLKSLTKTEEPVKALVGYGSKLVQVPNTSYRTLRALKTALGYDSKMPGLYLLTGMTYLQANKTKPAIEFLDKAIELDPSGFFAYRLRGFAYAFNKQFDKALADMNKALELKPDNLGYYFRAQVYADQNKNELALQDLNKSIELDAKDSSVYKLRAKVNAALGKKEASETDLAKAKELSGS
jgi:tetratricopeptide (TPR) repeat protein